MFGSVNQLEVCLLDSDSNIETVILRGYPKVSGLAAWSGNCKWYSSLILGAVVSLFCELV